MKEFNVLDYVKTMGWKSERVVQGMTAAQDMLELLRREGRPMRAKEINDTLLKENPHNFVPSWWGDRFYSVQRVVQQAKKLKEMGLLAIDKVSCEPYDVTILLDWRYNEDAKEWEPDPDGRCKIITVKSHTYYRAI